jgi:hypothetical protein
VAVLAAVVVGHGGPRHAGPRRAAAARHKQLPSPESPFAGSPTRALGKTARWPAAIGDCGAPVYLPRIHLAPQHVSVQGTVLVGGTALRQVRLGRGVYRALPGLGDRGLLVSKLVSGPGADYAFVEPRCSGYLWVYRITAGAAHRLSTTADDLLGGPRHAWAVIYRSHTVLTPLNGGRSIVLTSGGDPVADTPAGLVVFQSRAARAGTAELVDPDSGAVLRRLAPGYPMGATERVALMSLPGCSAPLRGRPCRLESISLRTGRPRATFALPAGRVPVSDAVVSPDGAAAAFLLARARQGPGLATAGPSPPADVAVLNLTTGGLDIVPGLELPLGVGAGLAFDVTGGWLLVTVSEGNRGELLAWRHGMPGPALVASLPGPLVAAPPLLTPQYTSQP